MDFWNSRVSLKARSAVKSVALPIILIVTLFFSYTKRQIKKNRRESQRILALLETVFDERTLRDCSNTPLFPLSLCNTPLGEDDGVVLDVKTVDIRNLPAPFNGSIIESDSGGFLLFFRSDEFHYNFTLPYKSYIGCVKLDENFNQTEEEYTKIELENESNEDPRVFRFQGDLCLSYNSIKNVKKGSDSPRVMKLARLDPNTLKVKSEISLDLRKQKVEKNWTPFCFTQGDKEEVFFKYYLEHNQNLRVEAGGGISELFFPSHSFIKNLGWPHMWGDPRGGTPALKIGDEYLAFFHSSFGNLNGSFWYIMGAYTFEGAPPFRITAISHYPIFFKGVFNSPILNAANPRVRCVFPSGFVMKEKDGKELIYLSIGENDTRVKILTLDKKALLKSLKKLNF